PFGRLTAATSGAPDTRLGFQSQYNDPLSGAYDLRARDYTSTDGRFHSVDPLAQPIDDPAESAYAYAHDNPLTGSDPSGQAPGGGCVYAHNCHVLTDEEKRQEAHGELEALSWIPIFGGIFMTMDIDMYRDEGNNAAADALEDALGSD